MGYNGRKTPSLWDTMEENLPNFLRLLLIYPTMEENLFCCIPQRWKTSSIVSHTTEENLLHYIPHARNAVAFVSHNGRKLNS
jgi:hypothetical protein